MIKSNKKSFQIMVSISTFDKLFFRASGWESCSSTPRREEKKEVMP